VDLKGFSKGFYRKFCGGDLQTVLDTLRYLKRETKVWFEVTTLLIPGENDSDEELRLCRAGSPGNSGRMRRCISRRSIRTGS